MFRALLGYQRWADRLSEITGTIAKWIVIPTVAIGFGPFERRVCPEHVDGYTIQRKVA